MVENKQPTNWKERRQNLKTELNLVKSKLSNLPNTTKKTELERELNGTESQINNLSGLNLDLTDNTIKRLVEKLEQELKEIKQAIEDNPNEDPEPTNKSKAEVKFVGKSLKDQDSGDFDNYKFLEADKSGSTKNILYISKNHPQIKQLLSQNKLQKDKKFTIRYGKIDNRCHSPSEEDGSLLTFNENNQDLEIIEVKGPSPVPNPNPQPNPDPNQNELTKYIVEKINDNTFKYRFTVNNDKNSCQGYDNVSCSDFIHLLKSPHHPQYEEFFKAFQGALKDANAKFPGYFWKCPPVSLKTFDKPFEFVVIKSEAVNSITQNYSSFQEHFGKSRDNQSVSFLGFSGSTLISPVPKGTTDYKNISQFTKNAPDEQQQALWKEAADSLMKELEKDENSPRWLNTEGTGVPYLHVRIDKTSRFYSNYPEWK